MRRRASELGIRYAPFPPYEVLSTNEIPPDELQTARMLSRLIDGFYNAPPWQEITRRLIVEASEFLHRFLDYLIRIGVIDQPMSLERRGILLYKFCKENYPTYETDMTLAWIEAGMSLKKEQERASLPHPHQTRIASRCMGAHLWHLPRRITPLHAPATRRGKYDLLVRFRA